MSDLASVVIYQASSEPIAACWPVRTKDSLVLDVATLASPTILLVNLGSDPEEPANLMDFPGTHDFNLGISRPETKSTMCRKIVPVHHH